MKRPPDVAVTFFVDRSLGKHGVADAMRAAGEAVRVHDDLFPQDTLDVNWVPAVGHNGWFALTKDTNLFKNHLELLAIRQSGIGLFALTNGNLAGPEMAVAFVAARLHMRRIAVHRERPFVAVVHRSGAVKIRLTTADLFRMNLP